MYVLGGRLLCYIVPFFSFLEAISDADAYILVIAYLFMVTYVTLQLLFISIPTEFSVFYDCATRRFSIRCTCIACGLWYPLSIPLLAWSPSFLGTASWTTCVYDWYFLLSLNRRAIFPVVFITIYFFYFSKQQLGRLPRIYDNV